MRAKIVYVSTYARYWFHNDLHNADACLEDFGCIDARTGLGLPLQSLIIMVTSASLSFLLVL